MANNLGSGGPKRERITTLTAIFLVGTAILFDLLQDLAFFLNAIPIAGQVLDVVISWAVSIIASVVFGIWFALLGVNYFSGKKAGQKLLVALASVIIEFIPFIDAIPAITFGVISIIILTRIEDKGMTGTGIMQTVAGTARVAGTLGLRGDGTATRGVTVRGQERPPLSKRAHRDQFLDLRRSRPQRRPEAGTDTPTN